jgi:cation:H+ antiporter
MYTGTIKITARYSVDGWIITAQILGGLALLFFGGDFLVRGAVGLANRLGIAPVIIGLTIVAYGTSAPEWFVSVQAAMDGFSAIALGNVIGSNISNILLVLGASAMIYPVAVGSENIRRESLFLVGITLLLSAMVATGGLTRISGVIFLLLVVGFTWMLFQSTRKAKAALQSEFAEEVEDLAADMNYAKALMWLGLGFVMLIAGSQVLIPGAVSLAQMFGLSEALIGVTVVAVGGSAPELATSVIAALKKHADIAIGNLLGSNIFNIIGVLGTAAAITPIDADPRFLYGDIPFLIGSTVLFTLLLWKVPTITRLWGGVFLASYVAYVSMQFFWLG